MPQRFYKAIIYRNPDQDMKVSASRTDFRLLRYFSTVLISFRYSLETHPESFRDSNSRCYGRSSSLRTVTETPNQVRGLMPLKSTLLIMQN